jgi:hypothetical protein
MRRSSTLCLLAVLALLVVGCAPFSDDELRGLVDGTQPAQSSMLACEWGSEWGSDTSPAPESYYGCSYSATGDVAQVVHDLVASLARQGFNLSCTGGPLYGELVAARGEIAVVAEVSVRGDLQSGQVFLSVSAARFGETQFVEGETAFCHPAL